MIESRMSQKSIKAEKSLSKTSIYRLKKANSSVLSVQAEAEKPQRCG